MAEKKAIEERAAALVLAQKEATAQVSSLSADKQASEQELANLQAQMKDLKMAQTTRGVVATFEGVLFDSGKTTLNASMTRSLDPLVLH